MGEILNIIKTYATSYTVLYFFFENFYISKNRFTYK